MKLFIVLLLLAAFLWFYFRLRQADALTSLPVVTEIHEK
jgi:hypothetical protein